MSTTYEETIYDYLTQPENYRAAKQIAGQIGTLDERLAHDFWQEVQRAVQQQLAAEGWEVLLSLPDWFSVRRPGWERMGVNCDALRGRPDFGLHCSASVYDRAKVDALLQAAGVREQEGMKGNTAEWPCYRPLTSHDFREQATMERILPANRQAAVSEMVDTVVGFVKKYGPVLDRIHQEANL
ncbi:hypothetical protein EJV47_04590 [Hymenobacter gummosus]|uniref:Uncharacterized protein n=1 Tax=Hymenobacter gummosus TaxID=1776032 RepID=A0A3S0JGC9_9BACT|nr:hypothetical protein [Hymenobacter gummosus]RTQ52305.1 hypothetical protein EJV47_04590 [Hymenobacter gummosus]